MFLKELRIRKKEKTCGEIIIWEAKVFFIDSFDRHVSHSFGLIYKLGYY